jgi:hypothetical protein
MSNCLSPSIGCARDGDRAYTGSQSKLRPDRKQQTVGRVRVQGVDQGTLHHHITRARYPYESPYLQSVVLLNIYDLYFSRVQSFSSIWQFPARIAVCLRQFRRRQCAIFASEGANSFAEYLMDPIPLCVVCLPSR